MTHTYLITQINSELEKKNLQEFLVQMPNVSHVHFPNNPRHISITLNSYATIEKINKYLEAYTSHVQLVKQINVHPNFTEANETTGKIFKEFGIILAILFIVTIIYGSYHGLDSLNTFLRIYVGIILSSFGVLKIFKLMDFAESHQRYDIISKHFVLYAYLYPFIELLLGILLILNHYLILAYIILIVVLLLRTLSVLYYVAFSEGVEYAYLDGIFKIRVSYATISIDLLIILFSIFQLTLLIK